MGTAAHISAPPSSLCCPITGQLLCDPVVIADGHTYEKLALQVRLFANPRDPPLLLEQARPACLPRTARTAYHPPALPTPPGLRREP